MVLLLRPGKCQKTNTVKFSSVQTVNASQLATSTKFVFVINLNSDKKDTFEVIEILGNW